MNAGQLFAAAVLCAVMSSLLGADLFAVSFTQGVLLINMLGWSLFASAVTGVGSSTQLDTPLSQGYVRIALFFIVKSIALGLAILWVVSQGAKGLSYLAVGYVAQLLVASAIPSNYFQRQP